MNKLWVFGDSFSSLIDFHNLQNENVKRYLTIKNIDRYQTWSEILALQLNFELKNFSFGGKSNYQIFFDVCDNIEKFSKNDILIVGWALLGKFIIVDNNHFIDIHPNGVYNNYQIENNCIQKIIDNRKNELWVYEVRKWEKIISEMSKYKGFKIIFWSGEEDLLKNKSIDISTCPTISNETNGFIPDTHLGCVGHEKLSENMYNILTNE